MKKRANSLGTLVSNTPLKTSQRNRSLSQPCSPVVPMTFFDLARDAFQSGKKISTVVDLSHYDEVDAGCKLPRDEISGFSRPGVAMKKP